MDLRRLGEGDIVPFGGVSTWIYASVYQSLYHKVDAHVNASRSHDLHESRAWPQRCLFQLITAIDTLTL